MISNGARSRWSAWTLVGAIAALGCGSSSDAPSNGVEDTLVAADTGVVDARDETTADAPHDTTSAGDVADDTGSGADTSETTDAFDASDATDPLASLVGCLGTSAPLVVSAQMPYMTIPVGSESGAFVIDLASTFSSIDLKAFPAPGPTTHGCDPTKLFQSCTVDGFAFFSPPGPVVLVTEDFSGISGSVRQAGIVGTDFTSLKIVTASYATSRIFASGSSGFCSDALLAAAGFGALSSAGFFSNSFASLKPMSDVDSTATSGHVPDVPTVPVRIAGASAVAQLDTGFDDALVHFSINVNGAFYSAIVAADASALVRDAAHDLVLSTCTGGSESVQAYSLAAGRSLDFVDASGTAVRSYPGAAVFVKSSSPKACGGIGTWTVPAAQVAASYFVDMGTVVFDPYSSRVWFPR